MILEAALVFGLGLAALARRRPPAGDSPPTDEAPVVKPPKASRVGWVQLQDAPGLQVRAPSRSWTSPAVRELLESAGRVAAALGAQLQIGDVGPKDRGTPMPSGIGTFHKSHRWGRDLDVAYAPDAYPTPDDVPVDPRILAVLDALAPWIEKVGVNVVRAPPFEGHPFTHSVWPGHAHHLHLRLRPELVDEPAAAGLFGFATDADEDDDD